MQKILVSVLMLVMMTVALQAKNTLTIFHLDFNSVSLKPEYIRLWLRKAADMGYNAVLWEIEDDIRWNNCQECASPEAFTKDEFRDILNYSRKLGLEPIPLLQTIGHAEYVLQHKKYKSFREDPLRYDCYCTTNPEVRIFIKNWINEYLELFGSIKYFHLGGDEAYAFASCSECRRQADNLGENYLYAEYLNDISGRIREKGIRPGIWSDMILKNPEDISLIGKEFVIWDWNYWDGCETPNSVMVWSAGSRLIKEKMDSPILNNFPEIITTDGRLNAFYTSDFLKRLGYDVILCSSSRSHGDAVFAGRNDVHVDNIIGAAKKTMKENLFGNCVTSWAVRIHNYEIQEPWLYLCPLTLQNPSLSKKELLLNASENLFGVRDTTFFQIAAKIGYSFPFANEKSTGIMWTGMKDSKPAPDNYIHGLLEKWSGSIANWTDIVNKIRNSEDLISAGIYELNKFIPRCERGITVLNAWSTAGYFQYWQAIAANEIINTAEKKTVKRNNELGEILFSLKNQYKSWAITWMSEDSAQKNSGLIYDALLNYFKDK